jgi:hypothetical protein
MQIASRSPNAKAEKRIKGVRGSGDLKSSGDARGNIQSKIDLFFNYSIGCELRLSSIINVPSGPLVRKATLMMLLGLLGSLVGVVLGMRYRVLILFPAIALAWAAIAAAGFAGENTSLSMFAAMLLTGTALQFGFLVGITTRALVAATRAPSCRGKDASQLPAAQ